MACPLCSTTVPYVFPDGSEAPLLTSPPLTDARLRQVIREELETLTERFVGALLQGLKQ